MKTKSCSGGSMRLFRINFFHHVYLITFWVDKLILQETKFLAGIDFYAKTILHLPFKIKAYDALGYKCFYVWIDIELKSLLTKIVDNVINFVFQRVCE